MSRVSIAAESLAAEGPTESRAERAERRPRAIRRKKRMERRARARGASGAGDAWEPARGSDAPRNQPCKMRRIGARGRWSLWVAAECGRGERAHAEIRFVPLDSTRDCSARLATGDEELEQMDGRWRRSRTDWTVLRVMINVG